jgi:hypothetical protein
MGTQQLLLIVLGVIIVGIAIAVGINIFNNQAYNSNQQAIAQENNTYASMVLQWYKTPVSQGGHGQGALVTADRGLIAGWLGYGATETSVLTTDTGKYAVLSATAAGTTVVLVADGTEKRGSAYPKITTTVNLATSTITSVATTDTDTNPLD